MQNCEPDELLLLRTPRQWKAMSHPLRLGIVRLLRLRAMTNEELSHELGVASGHLSFHTKQLLEAGLIRLVGTRQKRSITEKLYRATALHFGAASPLEDVESSRGDLVLESARSLYLTTAREYPDLLSCGPRSTTHDLLLLAPEKAEEIVRKFESLVQEAVDSRSAEPGAIPMALTVLLYPLPAARLSDDNGASGPLEREQE